MRAALPMYERPQTRGVHDRFWALILEELTAAGIDAPADLDRSGFAAADLWSIWTDPELLLTQTCGLPFARHFSSDVTLVGSPNLNLPGTPAGHYFSHIVKRAGASLPDQPRPAINDTHSQSGWNAMLCWSEDQGLDLREALLTGAHFESLRAVGSARADIAAIDAATWRLAARYAPELCDALEILDDTPPTPAPPFITAKPELVAPLQNALSAAIARLTDEDKTALSLWGVVTLPLEAYNTVRAARTDQAKNACHTAKTA